MRFVAWVIRSPTQVSLPDQQVFRPITSVILQQKPWLLPSVLVFLSVHTYQIIFTGFYEQKNIGRLRRRFTLYPSIHRYFTRYPFRFETVILLEVTQTLIYLVRSFPRFVLILNQLFYLLVLVDSWHFVSWLFVQRGLFFSLLPRRDLLLLPDLFRSVFHFLSSVNLTTDNKPDFGRRTSAAECLLV